MSNDFLNLAQSGRHGRDAAGHVFEKLQVGKVKGMLGWRVRGESNIKASDQLWNLLVRRPAGEVDMLAQP
jgi:hypothetical protein